MLTTLSPYPFILPNGEQRNGYVHDANQICIRCQTKECAAVGYAQGAGQVVHSCFQGLNFVPVRDFEGEAVVWNGFLLKGFKYPSDYKALLKTGFELDEKMITSTRDAFAENGPAFRHSTESRKRGQSRATHDLKHLLSALTRVIQNREVLGAAEAASWSWSPDTIKLIKQTIVAAYNILGAIKNQIELSDYIVSHDAAEYLNKRDIDVYPLFDKSVRMYNVLAEQQSKRIEISSASGFIKATRNLKEQFVLLPVILIQNALKYSIEDRIIHVRFSTIGAKLRIVIESIGPIIPESERQRIWKSGEQYIHPNDTSKGGDGHGLPLAQSICATTGFSIDYEGEETFTSRGIPMGTNRFVVTEL